MGYYRIKSILHSGTYGKRNTPRTDDRYPLRINRIVDLNDDPLHDDIELGKSLAIKYVKDEKGNDLWGYLVTSCVVDWDYVFNNMIRVETNNSIYEFEKIYGEV